MANIIIQLNIKVPLLFPFPVKPHESSKSVLEKLNIKYSVWLNSVGNYLGDDS